MKILLPRFTLASLRCKENVGITRSMRRFVTTRPRRYRGLDAIAAMVSSGPSVEVLEEALLLEHVLATSVRA